MVSDRKSKSQKLKKKKYAGRHAYNNSIWLWEVMACISSSTNGIYFVGEKPFGVVSEFDIHKESCMKVVILSCALKFKKDCFKNLLMVTLDYSHILWYAAAIFYFKPQSPEISVCLFSLRFPLLIYGRITIHVTIFGLSSRTSMHLFRTLLEFQLSPSPAPILVPHKSLGMNSPVTSHNTQNNSPK